MGTMALAQTEFCTTNPRYQTEEWWYDWINRDVSGGGSVRRGRSPSELDKRERGDFIPDPKYKRSSEIRSHIGTGTIGPLPAQDFLLSWPNLVTNIPTLEQHAEGIGVLASAPQPDLVTRTYPLAIGVEGKIYPKSCY